MGPQAATRLPMCDAVILPSVVLLPVFMNLVITNATCSHDAAGASARTTCWGSCTGTPSCTASLPWTSSSCGPTCCSRPHSLTDSTPPVAQTAVALANTMNADSSRRAPAPAQPLRRGTCPPLRALHARPHPQGHDTRGGGGPGRRAGPPASGPPPRGLRLTRMTTVRSHMKASLSLCISIIT
jgi:hypothetical protein